MWLDSLVPDGELASQQQKLQFTAETPEPGFWQGSGDVILPNLERGFLEAGASIESGFSSMWQGALDGLAGALLPEPKHYGRPDVTSAERSQQRTLGEGTAAVVKELRPDPRTTGTGGQLLGEAAAILPRTVGGAFFGGPIGGAVMAGGPAGYSSKQVAMSEGIDESTATLQGVIEGTTVGVGALLPAAKFVKPVTGDLAIAVGANVGLGVASRGLTGELLEGAGYSEQAAQYRALDGTGMAIDAVLGAAFFGIGRGMARRPAPQHVDAALVENNALHAELDTAPGIPVDPQAANTHLQALDIATEQLARGERVLLPDDTPEVAFLRAERQGPIPDELARAADEQGAIDARSLGDDFAARVGRASAYDETGAPAFNDGTAYPLREVVRFFEQYVEPTQPKDGTVVPDVLFQIGQISEQVAQGLHRYLPGFHDGLREARISGQSVKHIMDSRPTLVRDVLEKIQKGALEADEVLPNPKNRERALVVLRNAGETASSKPKHLSHVVELSANGKGVDVVTVMTARDGALKEARALKAELDAKGETTGGGATYPSSSLEAGAPRQPHAAADFPTVARDQDASIRPGAADATDPEVRLAQSVLDEVGDIQVPTGAIDADGNPVTVSARELLAEADADIQRAQLEGRGIEAAAGCALQRGD